jgi:hypothetical protein
LKLKENWRTETLQNARLNCSPVVVVIAIVFIAIIIIIVIITVVAVVIKEGETDRACRHRYGVANPFLKLQLYEAQLEVCFARRTKHSYMTAFNSVSQIVFGGIRVYSRKFLYNTKID